MPLRTKKIHEVGKLTQVPPVKARDVDVQVSKRTRRRSF